MKNVKMHVLQALQMRFGNKSFGYTDILKEVLLFNQKINDFSEYDWRNPQHRGYYASAITGHGGKYWYKFTAQNPWRLVKFSFEGKTCYQVECCL
jgi:hypothetical protein